MPRIAVVEEDKCHPDKCGNYLCIRLCPINRDGTECITKAESGKARIDESLCTGCGICPNRCPFGAIHIINLPEELGDKMIHRYGQNGFHLYSLPTPIFGKVVGIIGVNGIGKSTALKILSGMLKPNLGKETEATYEELIEYFKGTEAQIYFERLKEGEIKVSYKPQQVELIAKTSSGKVGELLKKIDERNKMEEIVEKLDLTKLLEHDVAKLSGGELQRLAIAATVLKKANLYVFDEPTSYLDIKQRIKVSRFIKELANEETAVLVVEHDLIILDYMTDLIHLMYGKENAYGIVSLPKSTKEGINIYLSGYLRAENMRFRNHAISFEKRAPTEEKERVELTEWDTLEKKYEQFEVKVEEGVVHENEVIGIVGENGIGKTSFVKLLAGVEKPTGGKVKKELKVSYKPQYLNSDSEDLVMVVLQDAIKKYDVQLIRALNLKPLLEKKLCELSGGQLQRVAIAECLGRDADMYLMDEPSAYLDVEQRLIASKVIRDMMNIRQASAMIVDHDLLFIDYLSDTIMVFEGEPAVRGFSNGPKSMVEGMNTFLEDLKLTFRRDEESGRPRANKPGSQMDQKQISENKLYYT